MVELSVGPVTGRGIMAWLREQSQYKSSVASVSRGSVAEGD